MTRELTALGLRFADPARYLPTPRPLALGHQPWLTPPWHVLLHAARSFPAGLSLSQCLVERCRGGGAIGQPGMLAGPYSPGNLSAYLIGVNPAAGISVV